MGPCSAAKDGGKRSSMVTVVNCGTTGLGHLQVQCRVEGEYCEAVVDLGASDTIVSSIVMLD